MSYINIFIQEHPQVVEENSAEQLTLGDMGKRASKGTLRDLHGEDTISAFKTNT